VLCACLAVTPLLADGCGKTAKDGVHQKPSGIETDRISIDIQLRLLSEVKGGGQYTDDDFLSQKKHSLLLHFERKNPEADEAKIVDYIFQNLPSGTWIVDVDEPKVTADGEKVTIGNITILIKDGSQYLGYRFKRVHAEAKRLFGEDVILEMIQVGVRIYANPDKGIEIETGRLYPINDGGITKEMWTQLEESVRQSYEAPKK